MPSLAWPTRALFAFAVALLASMILCWAATVILRRLGVAQQVRLDGPETHLAKTGTTQMGGLGFIAAIVVVAGLAGLLQVRDTLSVVLLMLGFGFIGFVDDYTKFAKKSPYGWLARYRLPLETVIGALFVGLTQMARPGLGPQNALPVYALGVFVVVGGANAVNLTDGLDGLAAGLAAIVGVALAVVAALLGRDPQCLVLTLIVAGAAAGFLWVNGRPAQAFMGDVGSMSLGAALCGLAVALRVELLFGALAFFFVIEALSVMIQVASFQTTGRRVFRMAPFHHHLEQSGWPEERVVIRAWLATALVAAFVIGCVVWQTHGAQIMSGGPR